MEKDDFYEIEPGDHWLYQCFGCGAVVADRDLHIDFHKRLGA